MTTEQIEEWSGPSKGGFILPIAGLDISQIRIDYAITFAFEEKSALRIEAAGTLWSADNLAMNIDPNTEPTKWGLMLGVVNTALISADVDAEATLKLRFVNGLRFEVQPSPDYESWAFTRPTGQLLVCLAGGEMSYFTGSRSR